MTPSSLPIIYDRNQILPSSWLKRILSPTHFWWSRTFHTIRSLCISKPQNEKACFKGPFQAECKYFKKNKLTLSWLFVFLYHLPRHFNLHGHYKKLWPIRLTSKTVDANDIILKSYHQKCFIWMNLHNDSIECSIMLWLTGAEGESWQHEVTGPTPCSLDLNLVSIEGVYLSAHASSTGSRCRIHSALVHSL